MNRNEKKNLFSFAIFKQLMYNGTDISLLLKEIQRVQDVLMRVKEMKNGMLGSAMIQIQNEVNNWYLFADNIYLPFQANYIECFK